MQNKLYYAIMDIILGFILLGLSLSAIYFQEAFLMRIFDLLGFIILINGGKLLLDYLNNRQETRRLKEGLLYVLGAIVLLLYTHIPVSFVRIILGLFTMIYALIKGISYYLMKQSHTGGRLQFLIIAIITFMVGWLLFIGKYIGMNDAMIFIGLYGCLLGLTYIYNGIKVGLPNRHKNKIKRKLRISLPATIAALLPRFALEYINHSLEIIRDNDQENKISYDNQLEIFVHVSPDGMGTMGHCDIWFDHEIISYGNYDFESVRLFEAVGDGVLFTCKNKMDYLNFCIEESHKTIFGYQIKLNDEQFQAVQERIKSLKEITYPWFCHGYDDVQYNEDYASRLYHRTHASFYKFKKGKFKNYFVVGTNCVLLADYIVGGSGSDIVTLNGIITPGTYYSYLEQEYNRIEGIVTKKTIYQ